MISEISICNFKGLNIQHILLEISPANQTIVYMRNPIVSTTITQLVFFLRPHLKIILWHHKVTPRQFLLDSKAIDLINYISILDSEITVGQCYMLF